MQSELVLGFVGPVGVENSRFHNAAMARLKAFGYHPELIRLSERLDDLKEEGLLATELKSAPEYERVSSHMDAGDELRSLDMDGAPGLLADAAVATIAGRRKRNDQNLTMPMPGKAWLISSLKNPAEVEVFRRAYGPGFFLIGLFATESERMKALERGMTSSQARQLIRRDAEGHATHGQQTRKTFELADAWVNDEDQLCRVVDLIFGDTFATPTDDEDGMALAYTAALRSADLSRQVGAAIVSATGEVLATGRNEVPAPGGGQYSPPTPDRPTARDWEVGSDSNTRERLKIEDQIAGRIDELARHGFAAFAATLGEGERGRLELQLKELPALVLEALARSSLRDITEYGRAVHAEMSAFMSAARAGVSIRGATLYCTTFPCHNCAKHIAAAGIARVVFVEPYPKSKAVLLHADSITIVGETTDETSLSALTDKVKACRTRFEPFLGVGPRRYFDLFSMKLGTGRGVKRKDDDGNALTFDPPTATPRVPLTATSYLEQEMKAADFLEGAKQKLKERPVP